MKMKRRFPLVMALLLCCLACPMMSAEAADAFVVASATELSGMFFTGMWGNNTSDIDVRAMLHNYSPVVWSDQTSLEMNSLVVKDVSVGEYENGNRAYVIVLHDDLYYSDGTPILASDYIFSLMLQASPFIPLLGGMTGTGRQITGYTAYHAGETDAFEGLRLIDDHTFLLQVDGSNYPFFYELTYLDVIPYPIAAIAPGCEVVDTEAGAVIRNADASAIEPIFTADLLRETILDPDTGYLSHPSVTSGAYRLISFDWDTRMATFEINEYFKGTHDGLKPTISPIQFRSYAPDDMLAAFAAGEVHILSRLVSADMVNEGLALTAAGKAAAYNYPRMGLGYLNFACEGKVFRHEAVRKAVAYAFDKTAFCYEFTPYAVPVYGYLGIGQWLYTSVTSEASPSFATTDDERAAWHALSLDGLNKYEANLPLAEQLLEDDGWTLNERGKPYVKGVDTVRYKYVDDELTGLLVRWGRTMNSHGADLMARMLPGPLAEIGIELVIEEVSFQEVLQDFYRQQDRRFDLHMLASNISNLFDPSASFGGLGEGSLQSTTGLQDEALEEISQALRATQPGALLDYATKWVRFQERWNDKLPMLPLYSNIYFDFSLPSLRNYRPDAGQNWPEAIVSAYLIGEDGQSR